MCTYNISISDALMEQVRPVIGSDAEAGKWLQQQIELLLMRLVSAKEDVSFDEDYMANLIEMSASSWKGINDADAWVREVRGE